jgi:hypothetical protein
MAGIAFKFDYMDSSYNNNNGSVVGSIHVPKLYVEDANGVSEIITDCEIETSYCFVPFLCFYGFKIANGTNGKTDIVYNNGGDLVCTTDEAEYGVTVGSYKVRRLYVYDRPYAIAGTWNLFKYRENSDVRRICQLQFSDANGNRTSQSIIKLPTFTLSYNNTSTFFDDYVLIPIGIGTAPKYPVSGYFGTSVETIRAFIASDFDSYDGVVQNNTTYSMRVTLNNGTENLIDNNAVTAVYNKNNTLYTRLYSSTNGGAETLVESGIDWHVEDRETNTTVSGDGDNDNSSFKCHNVCNYLISPRVNGAEVGSVVVHITKAPVQVFGSIAENKAWNNDDAATVVCGTVRGLPDETVPTISVVSTGRFRNETTGEWTSDVGTWTVVITHTLLANNDTSGNYSGELIDNYELLTPNEYTTATIYRNAIPVDCIAVSYDLSTARAYYFGGVPNMFFDSRYGVDSVTFNNDKYTVTVVDGAYLYNVNLTSRNAPTVIVLDLNSLSMLNTNVEGGAMFEVCIKTPSVTIPIVLNGFGTFMDSCGVPTTWLTNTTYRVSCLVCGGNVISKVEEL